MIYNRPSRGVNDAKKGVLTGISTIYHYVYEFTEDDVFVGMRVFFSRGNRVVHGRWVENGNVYVVGGWYGSGEGRGSRGKITQGWRVQRLRYRCQASERGEKE
jgi:hypothetical protein